MWQNGPAVHWNGFGVRSDDSAVWQDSSPVRWNGSAVRQIASGVPGNRSAASGIGSEARQAGAGVPEATLAERVRRGWAGEGEAGEWQAQISVLLQCAGARRRSPKLTEGFIPADLLDSREDYSRAS